MRTRTLRVATTAALGAALALCGAASANAAPQTVTDDSVADFGAGTLTNTWVVEPGNVQLQPTGMALNFDGDALPADWGATQWTPPGGGATVAGGSVTVDGARVTPTAAPSANAPQTLEFRATFGAEAFEHAGFDNTFDNGPHAIFSTGGGTLPVGLYARTVSDAPGATPSDFAIAGVDPTAPHVYRIEWTATDVEFSVDGNLVHTETVAIAGPLRPGISDFSAGGGSIKVDWLAMSPSPASGTFESAVHDAGTAKAVWSTLTATGTDLAGVTYETRTGNTPTPDGSWSAYAPLGASDAIASPPGRYLQYRATLSGTDPSLDTVVAGFDEDDQAPNVSLDGVAVSGSTATATFSVDDASAAVECSLDGGAWTACASPATLSGLAVGGHTLSVRATDAVGNVGTASRSFTVDAPPATGGGGDPGSPGTPSGTPGTQPPSGGGTKSDRRAPRISITVTSLTVSRKGVAKLPLTCPKSERRCTITVSLMSKGVRVARKTITLKGRHSGLMALRLNHAARTALADHGRLKVRAQMTARDAAGNSRSSTKRLTLRAPAH